MDILEVPQLMDICMRNGSYDDALDLRAFVAKLALIHPHLQASEVDASPGAFKSDMAAWKPAA